jgi:lipid-binding SYLF domain-containing protein
MLKDGFMKIVSIVVASALVLTTANVWAASAREDSVDRLQAAGDVLHSIQDAADHGIPDSVLNDAKCIIVVPNLIKGGFVFGAKHGRGVATCRTAEGWSAPAFVSIGGGSWGLQIGVEEVDLVMLVMNDHGVQHLLSSKFELSGQGAVAAGPIGREAVAGTDWTLNAEILSYSRTKGIFAGLTLEGAVVEQDNDSTEAIYGHEPSFRRVLSGRVADPAPSDSFLREVNRISAQAHADVK